MLCGYDKHPDETQVWKVSSFLEGYDSSDLVTMREGSIIKMLINITNTPHHISSMSTTPDHMPLKIVQYNGAAWIGILSLQSWVNLSQALSYILCS